AVWRGAGVKRAQLVDAPSVRASPTAGIEARASTARVERQATEAVNATRAMASEPTTTADATKTQMARRTDASAKAPETAAQPTLQRQVAEPAATPRTQ